MNETKKPPSSEFLETGFRQDVEMELVNWIEESLRATLS